MGKTQYGNLASYKACVEKHAAFHKEAGVVAAVINAENFAKAEALLNADTAFSKASNDVAIAIDAMKKETGL